ncbi:hypothetical protein CUZ95_0268 [Enterococcus lactis]|nr:hypothetical protein HMPREF1345_00423 [Enterococcus faecium TX1337RF]MBL5004891.1 hypothetical protein [Enterococcus lactis]
MKQLNGLRPFEKQGSCFLNSHQSTVFLFITRGCEISVLT